MKSVKILISPAKYRVDIELAIAAHGGHRAVAEAMQWSTKTQSRRPKGYWTRANLKLEVDAFNSKNQLCPGTIPSKALLLSLGRKDLHNVIMKMGGVNKVWAVHTIQPMYRLGHPKNHLL